MDIFDGYIDYVSEKRYGTLSIDNSSMAMPSNQKQVDMPEAVKPNVIEQAVGAGLQSLKSEYQETPVDALYGTARGTVEGAAGLPGDIISLVKGIYYAATTEEGKSKLEEFIKGAESATGLPTTEDIAGFLDNFIPKAEAESSQTLGQVIAPSGAVVKGAKKVLSSAKAKK